MRFRFALLVAFLAIIPTVVSAQIVNPRTILFQANTDHGTVDMGQPVVADYALELLRVGQQTVAQTLTLGKPTPGTGNDITINFEGMRTQLTVAPGDYNVRVVARGPGGETRSVASDPFVLRVKAPATQATPRLSTSSGAASSPTAAPNSRRKPPSETSVEK